MSNHLIVERRLNELPWQEIQFLLDSCYTRPPRDVFQKVVRASHQAQRVWIAQEKSNTIGMVMLSPHSKGGHLENLAVDPAARGKGIGTMLVTTLLTSIQSEGAAMVTLTTRIPDFFKPLGFKLYGELMDNSHAMMTLLPNKIQSNTKNHDL